MDSTERSRLLELAMDDEIADDISGFKVKDLHPSYAGRCAVITDRREIA